ncbi:MAG: glycosyltransferase family 4 protein, partial [Chloroflexota bacterium]|nr:glycosyltransferase family 4 protein [Chloroflexota bacterium]
MYTESLAQELGRRGHDVLVFYPEENITPGEEEETTSGFRVHRVLYPPGSNPLQLFLLSFRNPFVERSFARLIERERPDIVHFQHLKGLSVKLIPLVKGYGLPTIYSLHDYWLFCGNAQLITPRQKVCSGPFFWLNCAYCAAARIEAPFLVMAAPAIAGLFAYRAYLVGRAIRDVDLFVAPTAFVKEVFIKRGLPEGKVRQIDHGIDFQVREGTERLDDKFHFAYIGGLAWQKGVHVLIRAFNKLDPERAVLSVYGDEEAFPSYVEDLHRMARNPAIRFSGRLTHEELGPVLADTDVLVVPSLWYETSSLVIQEAFAAQVPVIASRLGALAEKVRHEVDGLLFAAGKPEALRQAMERLMETPSLL